MVEDLIKRHMERLPTCARLYYSGIGNRRYKRASTQSGPGEPLVFKDLAERELRALESELRGDLEAANARITALQSERDALVNSVAAGGKGAVAPDGWKLVPCHPDTAMKWAGALINNQGFDFAHATYAAMLDASPTAALENRDGRDAERYRHLRECNSGSLVIVQIIGTGDDDQIVLTEEDADAAIDAAMESDHE